MRALRAPLSKLFPRLFSIFRPAITLDVPVIVAASILADHEFSILPVSRGRAPSGVEKDGVRLFKAVGGQQVFRRVVDSRPEDYDEILWAPSSTISMWLGAVEYQDELERLLRVFDLTRFGDARVNDQLPPHGMATLEEVVSLYRERKLKCSLPAKEVSSLAISIAPDTTIVEAMRTMCERRVRRLFLGRGPNYISDRSILAFLLSPRLLTIAKDRPESWTSAPVSQLQKSTAGSVPTNATVEEVGMMAGANRDAFMLSDGVSLVSRWDLVMKPWEAEQLRLSI